MSHETPNRNRDRWNVLAFYKNQSHSPVVGERATAPLAAFDTLEWSPNCLFRTTMVASNNRRKAQELTN